MKRFRLDCQKFNNEVITDDNGVIIETAPIFQKFIGQPISNLTKWIEKKFGKYTLKEINKEK
jgi:hypothetical protein